MDESHILLIYNKLYVNQRVITINMIGPFLLALRKVTLAT